MNIYEVIKRPLVTEKGMKAQGTLPAYTFEIDKRATKDDVRRSVEKIFGVHVVKVNTSRLRGKVKRVGNSIGRRPNWKKAIVALRAGEKIEIFEGI